MLTSADYQLLVKRAGIDVEHCYVNGRDENLSVVCSIAGSLTFAMLSKASELMGTRSIDVACDTGTGSDRSHETQLVFNAPRPPSPPLVSTVDTHCSVCGHLQYVSPGGVTCPLGHGGAPSAEERKA